MSARAIEILSSPELHAELKQGARARAEQFAETAIIDRYEAYYRRVIDA
ncbi:MAG: hypothetical protein R2748_26385 [Bryobacterales bacterium]